MGMGSSLAGLLLSMAPNFVAILASAALPGVESAVSHQETARIAPTAAGGQLGLAQSLFGVGGKVGSAMGLLLAAFIVLPGGQRTIAWFSAAALLPRSSLPG